MIDNRTGEHPTQLAECMNAPCGIGSEQHFGIGFRAERTITEFPAKLHVVVNLAIQYTGHRRNH